jgi:hypothetical protein
MDGLSSDEVIASEPEAGSPRRRFDLSSGMRRLVVFSRVLAIAAIIAGVLQALLYVGFGGFQSLAYFAGELLGLKDAFFLWTAGVVLLIALRLVSAPDVPAWVPRLDARFAGRARALTMATIVVAFAILVMGVLGGLGQVAWVFGQGLMPGRGMGVSEWISFAAFSLFYYASQGVWHFFLLLAAALVARTLLALSRRVEERAQEEKEGAA